MQTRITEDRLVFLIQKLQDLLQAKPLPFAELTPSKVPIAGGVYVITASINGEEHPYYVGRTKNLQQRLYNNHLMGRTSNAGLKKYLLAAGEVEDVETAKQFIKARCSIRWIEEEDFRQRAAIEGCATAMLLPKHGIYEEH
jgi:hypothetical protein